MRHLRLLPPAASLLLAPALGAQQFQLGGSLPGGATWSEGVEAADVDLDGDLDLFFANGEGQASAGTPRQNTLIVNRLEIAPFTFADESVARLGVAETHARDVVTGDVDGDGWVDALFAVAFETHAPWLYVNRGAAQPGFFDAEGAARGLTEALSSSAARFGDTDGDGDLDLVITDAGADLLGGAGGQARLYVNDGAGVFSEASPADWPAPLQVAPMDAKLVDIDLDWDLDFLSVARSGDHVLLLNDGDGGFTDGSGLLTSVLLPTTTGNISEFEVGDLDADTDPDLFALELVGAQEGGVRNDLLPLGPLGFTPQPTVGSGDDRAVALFDYDQDRDFDAFIASSSGTEEILENRPIGIEFSSDSGAIQSVADTTLDLTVVDLDNDGAYDVVTAQGESDPASWENRYYVNTGLVDVLAPIVVRQQKPARFGSPIGPWPILAEVRDQVLDDGQNWVKVAANYQILDAPNVVEVTMAGFDFVPANVTVPVGTTVRWDNPTFTGHTVTSFDDVYTFNSGFMDNGDVYEYTFVKPGVYDYYCIPHLGIGMVGTVTVTGPEPERVEGRLVGGGLHRVEMLDTSGGTGRYVAYELEFTDAGGNAIVRDGNVVETCQWSTYGEGLPGANLLSLVGGGSARIGETFEPEVGGVLASPAVLLPSLGAFQFPWLGGTGLFNPAQLILPPLGAAAVGGVATFSIPIPNNPALDGASVYFQALAQDPSQVAGWALSNGLELTICE